MTRPGSLRILYVTARYLPYVGGTEIHTDEVARRVAAAGHEVTVLTTDPDRRLPPCEEVAGVRIHRVPAWPAQRDYYFAPDIYRIILQGSWDLIHCQGFHTLAAPVAMLAAWRAKIPYIVTFHSGGHSSRMRNLIRPVQLSVLRPLLARSAGLVGVSRWEADFFRKQLNLPEALFSVIPNGSYLPKVTRFPKTPGDGTRIVSVGRLERYKGHHLVISALPRVAREVPDVRFRIVGSGPYRDSLMKLASRLGVAGRVEIQAIPGEDREGMASVLMSAALVILLSSYESQGISVMEALSLGRPVLVADQTALGELADRGLAQATSLRSSPDQIASAILDQLHDPLIPSNTELPTWGACAHDLLALYCRILIKRSECVF
jgi:glycosyltransferase involved in cell wall biosynthesis